MKLHELSRHSLEKVFELLANDRLIVSVNDNNEPILLINDGDDYPILNLDNLYLIYQVYKNAQISI